MKRYHALFNRFQLIMTLCEAKECSHIGDCEKDVRALLSTPEMQKQFSKLAVNDIRQELQEYGAWTEEELKDVEMNQVRLLWIAACNIWEEYFEAQEH